VWGPGCERGRAHRRGLVGGVGLGCEVGPAWGWVAVSRVARPTSRSTRPPGRGWLWGGFCSWGAAGDVGFAVTPGGGLARSLGRYKMQIACKNCLFRVKGVCCNARSPRLGEKTEAEDKCDYWQHVNNPAIPPASVTGKTATSSRGGSDKS